MPNQANHKGDLMKMNSFSIYRGFLIHHLVAHSLLILSVNAFKKHLLWTVSAPVIPGIISGNTKACI